MGLGFGTTHIYISKLKAFKLVSKSKKVDACKLICLWERIERKTWEKEATNEVFLWLRDRRERK